MSSHRRTHCVRIEAVDGTVERFAAEYPHDLHMSNGQIYRSGDFNNPSTRVESVSGGPGNIDFGFVDELSNIDRDQIGSGKWDDARVFLFATDWSNPVEDDIPLSQLTLGKIVDVDGRFTAQLMDLKDRLNQSNGRIHTPTCLWTFCDQHLDSGIIVSDRSRCGLDAAAFTVTGTITEVISAEQFRDDTRTEADDWFGNGEIIFTSGDNAGLSRRNVKAYLSNGMITTNSPFYFLPQVGDGYTMIAGCRKRGVEDCTGKFTNRRRFGGFGYVPTSSQVQKIGGQ